MATLELCYTTARGAGVCRWFQDAATVEKALQALAKRHIEANLYIFGESDEHGNRTPRVGGVDNCAGWNGRRAVQWQWWFDPAAFDPVENILLPGSGESLEPGSK